MGSPQPPSFTPTPQHQSLARFVGTWRSQVSIWMEPGSQPMVSQGTMVNSLALDGRFIQQEYSEDSGQFSGKGFIGYNDVDQRYEGFWIDTMSNFFSVEYGQHQVSGDRYVLDSSMTHPQTGKPVVRKSVITMTSGNEHVMDMYFVNDGKEFRTMSIRYTRA